MYCSSCGKKVEDNLKHCPLCGNLNPSFVNSNQTNQQQTITQQNNILPKKNNKALIIGIIGVLILTLLTIAIFFFLKVKIITWILAFIIIAFFSVIIILFSKKNKLISIISLLLISILICGDYLFTNNILQNSEYGNIADEIDELVILKSSLVSKGVNTEDLGNIMNGQYYFSDGENQYYSTFDENQHAHIYKSSDNGKSGIPIFDGFGWSLVVKNNWLYFSGNQGQLIDGTYNLYRIKTDGSGFETLNTGFCYDMNIYNKWLYYIKRPSMNSTESHVYRCELDGSNETLVVSGAVSYFIVFDDNLYYINNSTTLYKANPDGTLPMAISQETIDKFIIGNNKIIYGGSNGSIKTMDVNGSNVKDIRAAGSNAIGSINSYRDHIYYTEYDLDFDYELYAYKYRIHSVDFNGNNDTQTYEGS